MPEGDSIFRAARVLNQALSGQRVTRFDARTALLTRGAIAADPAGAVVTKVTAVGKHLLMHFDNGRVLRSHMRMHGSWHLYRPGEKWRAPSAAVRVVLETEPWVAIAVDVPVAEWINAADLSRHVALSRLGPDLLAPEFDAGGALTRLRDSGETPVAEALLDQSVMAGIGNVYKSEILFIAKISPSVAVSALDDASLSRIIAIARDLLIRNVAPGSRGRRTTRSMNPEARLFVYERGGRPCRVCATPIMRALTGPHQRSTYWCPRCQPTIPA